MSSTRPSAKRVRSDQDHSKADTKKREQDLQSDQDDKMDGKGGGDDDDAKKKKEEEEDEQAKKDDDWKSVGPFQIGASWEGWETQWRGSCWCNKTAFVYSTDPLQTKFCHCEDCQRLHGAPFQHAAVFKKESVRLDSSPEWLGFLSAHGEIHPLSNTPTPLPHKISCRACGCPLIDEGRNMIMAFPPCFEFPRTQKELERMNEIEQARQDGGTSEDKAEDNHEGDEEAEKNKDKETHNGPTDEDGKDVKTHRKKGLWSRAGLPDELKAQCHIFYERRVVDIKDGLVKWRKHKDTEEMGETEQ